MGTLTGAPDKRVSRLLDVESAGACFLEWKQAEASGKLEDPLPSCHQAAGQSPETGGNGDSPCLRKQADLLSTSPISSVILSETDMGS